MADLDCQPVQPSAPAKLADLKGKGKTSDSAPDSASSLQWIEKYRPVGLDDLVSHQDIITTVKRFMDQQKLPHLLFYGPAGTGKTSTILACARHLYGPKFKNMILELNASDDRGIAVVRDQIKSFASTKTLFSSGFKLIILDEADALTNVIRPALIPGCPKCFETRWGRRQLTPVIEQYTKNVRFCLICNYVGKIIPALQSRCTRFRFAPLEAAQIEDRLNHVVANEGVNITKDGKKALLKLSNGDMRRALNILQSAHAAHDFINEDTIYMTTGSPLPADIDKIVDWLFTSEFSDAYASMCARVAYLDIRQMQIEKGLAMADILARVFTHVSGLEMPAAARVFLLAELGEIE
ncbi:hypothetical protein HDU91_005979 [Kappamyces sp. JEL0680]|nr:hypothetical protein HDU91_005979 [Kappamyces sp. JEL0680]